MANAYSPTYPELVLEIQDICENTNSEFVSNIPRFIGRAADQVQRDVGLDIFRDYELGTLSAASYTRSQDWLIVRSIQLTASGRYLEQRDLDYVRMYGGSSGTPKVWAEDQETTLIVAPTPSSSLAVRVEFYKRLAALSVANPTNWLTRNVGDLLLVQALINAHEYNVAPERVQAMGTFYAALLPTVESELRDSERHRNEPIRSAPRPAVQAGVRA